MTVYPKHLVQNFIIVLLTMVFALPTGVYAAGGPRGYDPELSRPETSEPFDFEGYSVLCEVVDLGTIVEDRNRESLRGAVLRYRALTNRPETTGWVTVLMNYDQHIKSGKGTSWGESEFVDDMGMVTFIEESFENESKHFVWDVSGTMIGTGIYEGYMVDYVETPVNSEDVLGDEVPLDTCGDPEDDPVLGVSTFNGYIYEP